ncbi:MAG TPA: pirin family protein [Bryobacteraceae bacterium]|nr:pirin family protein [Bryobacteraceae bacterium]
MITIRRSEERGHFDHGWLNTYHTFSFAGYSDPAHMGFRALRVLNDDRVAAGRGFGAHAHRDMEILTYVLDGSLTHKDSMGEQHTFGVNTIQVMSAGTGVIHSEFNASASEPVRFLQIWIVPGVNDVEPSYQQIPFDAREKCGKLRLLASGKAADGVRAAAIHQDAAVYAGMLRPAETLTQAIAPGRYGWVQVARGSVAVNGEVLAEGDGAALSEEREVSLSGQGAGDAEFLFFDLS